VLRTDLNNSEIRYKKLSIFLTGGVYTPYTHLVCLRHWLTQLTECVGNCFPACSLSPRNYQN